jgi:hypothetical protein
MQPEAEGICSLGTVSSLDLHYFLLPIETCAACLESIRTIRKKYGSTHLYRAITTGQIQMAPIQPTEGTKVWYCKQKGRHCTVPRPPLWYSAPYLNCGSDVSLWLPPRPLTTTCTTLMSTNVPQAKLLAQPQSTRTQRWKSRLTSASSTVFNHATKHTGVGIVCAVAYFDPCVHNTLNRSWVFSLISGAIGG